MGFTPFYAYHPLVITIFVARTNKPSPNGPLMAARVPTWVTLVDSSIYKWDKPCTLVVWTPLENINRLGWLLHLSRKNKVMLQSTNQIQTISAFEIFRSSQKCIPFLRHWKRLARSAALVDCPLLLHLPLKGQTAPRCTWKGKFCIGANGVIVLIDVILRVCICICICICIYVHIDTFI